MPAPIPVPVRQAIFQRSRKGTPVATLAEEFELSERTVRHLVRRFHDRGQAGLVPDYLGGATKSAAADDTVRRKALQMRAQHPNWGGGLIRVLLQEELGTCPCERTLQRWFRQAALTPAPAGRRPARDESRARQPHEVWQMDAAERMRLSSGQQVSWLRIADECSGAVLETRVFPPGVLESGRPHGRAAGVAPDFFQVGTAEVLPSGQRRTLGIVERLAHRLGPVVDWPGCGDALESAAATARQRRHRAVAGHGQTLG